MNIIEYIPHIAWWAILLSAIPLPIFWWFKRFNIIQLLLGVVALFLAYVIELVEELILGAGSLLLMLVILAPVIEELSKFLMTKYGKNLKAGVGVGMGFAIIENAMYYTSLSTSVGLMTLFMFRELQDPILHTTTTSVSTRTWKKGTPWFLVAILMHSFYNYLAIYDNIIYSVSISVIYACVLGFMIYKNKIKN